MAQVTPQLIFIDTRATVFEDWVLEKLFNAIRSQLRKYPELDAYVQPSEARKHDFTVTYAKHDPSPIVVQLIGLPSKVRSPIISTAYVKG